MNLLSSILPSLLPLKKAGYIKSLRVKTCLVTSTILCVLLLLIATSRMRQRLKDMTKRLADLAHDVDDLTWGMADIGSPGELQRTLSEDDVHLDNLYERARTVKDGLRRFSENTSSKYCCNLGDR